jgi:hypothetical protein
MRRFFAFLLLALTLGAIASPAAPANQGVMFSIMMDDDHLIYRGDQTRDATLRRMKTMGVDFVRVTVLWNVVAQNAKYDRRGKKRKNFKPDDPSTYPRGNWDRYDRLVQAGQTLGVGIYFNVTGPGPRWAHRKAPKSQKRYQRTWEPKEREFFKFVKAVGRRYDGTYRDENDQRKILPRVGFWSIYNEPNQQGWLTPQYKRVGSQVVPWSPVMYRKLWRYGRAALDLTNHKGDIVLIGETAPLGSGLHNPASPIYPKKFIRELFCVSPSGSRYTGSSASKRDCNELKKIGTFNFTAWGHHPYTKFLSPTQRDKNRDSITIANINELSALLDQLGAKTGYLPANKPNFVAMTEFGYETNPPDPFSGIKPDLQAEYINLGDYIAYKDPRVIANTQFLLKDVEPIKGYKKTSKKHWFTYQSGLYYANGTPKPAAAAYNLPLVMTGKGVDSPYGQGVAFWGWLRFLPLLPPDQPQYVYLQFKPQGATDFQTVGDPIQVNQLGFFETVGPILAPGTWRAVWIEPISQTPVFSREVLNTG